MVPNTPEQPGTNASKDADLRADAKQDRKAAALRDNLKRRKAQARARRAGGSDIPEG